MTESIGWQVWRIGIMAGPKLTYEFELNNVQMAFLPPAKEQYGIPDESKVVRIIVDYLLSTPDTHATVFEYTRCLRCE